MELSFPLAKGVVAKCIFAKAWACSAELDRVGTKREEAGKDGVWSISEQTVKITGLKLGIHELQEAAAYNVWSLTIHYTPEKSDFKYGKILTVSIAELVWELWSSWEKGRWQGKDRKGQIFIFL